METVSLSKNVAVIQDKAAAKEVLNGFVDYMQLAKQKVQGLPMLLVISDLQDFVSRTGIQATDFVLALKNTHRAGLDVMIFSSHHYMSSSYDLVPKALREMKFSGLIGSRAYDSDLIKLKTVSSEPELRENEAYFVTRGGASCDKLQLPIEGDL